MNANTLCETICSLRKGAGMTQEQLADRLGISFQAVSKWENFQSCPDIMLLPELADIFHVSIDALFGRSVAQPLPAEAPEAGTAALPWPDDGGLYAAVFQGHRLLADGSAARELSFHYNGPAVNVSSSMNLVVESAEIQGSVSAGGDVECGTVYGDLNAGGDVECDQVYGSVGAGGDVDCGSVTGNVEAMGDVDCGSVGGDVRAGGDVDCGSVSGNITADGDVDAGFAFSTGEGKRKRGKIVMNGREIGDYDFHIDDAPLDLSRLGETIRSGVTESVRKIAEELRQQFGDK